MSDYFHESMVAKMISSNDYQQGYSIGFSSGYKQGRAEAIDDYNKELKSYLRKFSVHSVSDSDFDFIAKKLKENNRQNSCRDYKIAVDTDKCKICPLELDKRRANEIRADAVDEFANLLKANYDIYSGECSCRHSVSIDKVFEIAKQLKEKENIMKVHDAKVRAEAIDECIAKIVEFNSDGYECWWHTMCNILEQLKDEV